MRRLPRIVLTTAVSIITVGATVLAAAPATASGGSPLPVGAVFTLTNDPGGNAVQAYLRRANGSLHRLATVGTGGLGTGTGLGSQGALVRTGDGRSLLAVNPGSDDLSVLTLTLRGMVRIDTESSGGDLPISVTEHDGLVYVLNGGPGGMSISGFRLRRSGLEPIPGSTVATSGAPAQVSFSPDGTQLVVTRKMANAIDVYRINESGRAVLQSSTASPAPTPFGFEFDRRGNVLVSDAFGGAASGLTSWSLRRDGSLTEIETVQIPGQQAACWVVTARDARFAYVTNTGTNAVSSFALRGGGDLALLAAVAAPTQGSAPIDMAVSPASRYLYVLTSSTIEGFEIRSDGSLSPLGNPAIMGAAGLVAV
jgi:6-phosphogluconolactonase